MKQEKEPKKIENHKTAAWAETERLKPVSQVSVPSAYGIANAKEYVDENEK